MPTSTPSTGTTAGAADQLVAAVVVPRGDPEARRAIADLVQRKGWRVSGVYETGGGGDVVKQLVADAYGGAFGALIIPMISVLGPNPADALSVIAGLTDLHLVVESVEESWLAVSQPAVARLARWFEDVTRQARAEKIKASTLRSGRRPGRPRRALPPQAERLVADGMPVGRAARLLSIPESSLRRLLKEKAQERRFAELMVEAA